MANFKKTMIVFLSFFLVFSVTLPMNPIQSEAAGEVTKVKISDIDTKNSKYKPAVWSVEKGLMQLGHGNKFQAGTLVMEWQMLQMMAKLDRNYHLDYNNKDVLYEYYKDLNVPLYGAENASKRNANISRGHFARLYAAMNGLDLSEVQAVQYLYMNEITTGTTGKRTYEDYVPNRNINRGDMAVFLYRISQQGTIAVEGLTTTATGKDNNKITLPSNFVASKGGTVELPTRPGQSTNDKENRGDIYKAVKDITVSTEELIANGVDSSLISIELRDSYGNDISYDQSLAFKVTSENGATFSETGTKESKNSQVFYTDGPDLNVFVTAPATTKSINDTIRFEMVDPPTGFHTYKDQVIEVKVRYVPKPELRITYETYDPDQTEWSGGNDGQVAKPLPALPQGMTKDGASVPFTQKGVITVTDYDEDYKLMTGTKWETYTNPQSGQLTQGDVTSKEIQYGNAELKLEGQTISVWLFEEILNFMIGEKSNPVASNWGGLGSAKIMYTVNAEGRATYDLQGVMDEELTKQFDSTIHAAVIYLIGYLQQQKVDNLTLAHEESVNAIKAIYDRLSQIDKDILQKKNANSIGILEAAVAKMATLKKGKELAERPEGMERYTKVIVNLVLPSGVVVKDYKGSVEISFNGKSKIVSFDTNTKDYNKGTGYAGSAVAYFDDIVYGTSTVTAKLIDKDPRYDKALQGINNLTGKTQIYTNPKFIQNTCSLAAEIGFVVDHSGSMKAMDRDNDTSKLVKKMIDQLQADPSHVYRFSNQANFEASGKAKEVIRPTLLEYNGSDKRTTNIANSVTTVINNLSSSQLTSKAIVLVTDGKTNSTKISQMIQLAKDRNIPIHTIAVGKYNQKAESVLKEIATETKGTYRIVSDIHSLHGAMQSVITTILCNTVQVDNSCLVGDTLFTNTQVIIEQNNRVQLIASINTGCDNIEAVKVIFTSPDGEVSYDLRKRSNYRFMERPYIYEFPIFDLYVDVEFQAYDKNGKLLGSKMHDMSNGG